MRAKALALILVAWLLGIGTGLGGLAISGGWYEYRPVQNVETAGGTLT